MWGLFCHDFTPENSADPLSSPRVAVRTRTDALCRETEEREATREEWRPWGQEEGALSDVTLGQPDYRPLIGHGWAFLSSDWLMLGLRSSLLVPGVIVWTWGDIVPGYRWWLSCDSDHGFWLAAKPQSGLWLVTGWVLLWPVCGGW